MSYSVSLDPYAFSSNRSHLNEKYSRRDVGLHVPVMAQTELS